MTASAEYLNAINVINQKIDNQQATASLAEIRECFQTIASKFTMLPQHWLQWADLENSPHLFHDFDETKVNFHLRKIQSQALTRFYQKDFFLITNIRFDNFHSWLIPEHNDRFDSFFDFVSIPNGKMGKLLSHPHEKPKYFFHECQMLSLQPLPSKIMKKYHKAVELSELIKDKPLEEYIYLVPNVALAIEMIEWELGNNPLSINLWKFYIKFLKDKSKSLELLNAYSRYCRLFISDKSMKDEYLSEIKKLKNESLPVVDITKWWIDYIGIEKNFGSPNIAANLLDILKTKKYNFWTNFFYKFTKGYQRFMQCKENGDTNYSIQNMSLDKIDIHRISSLNVKIEYMKDLIKPNPSNIRLSKFKKFYLSKKQNISLPHPIITYIYHSSSNEFKFKLLQTCKYLFYRGKQILCHNLTISTECKSMPTFCERSLILNPKDLENVNLKKYRITNTLRISINIQNDLFSKVIKMIQYADIKCIRLYHQQMSINELNILPCHQIIDSNLVYVTVIDLDKNIFQVEDLVNLFPNATTKRIITNNFNENSSKFFAKIQFPIKLNNFMLFNIPESFDSNDFIKFLKTNVKNNARIFLKFHSEINDDFREAFTNNVKTVLLNLVYSLNYNKIGEQTNKIINEKKKRFYLEKDELKIWRSFDKCNFN